MAEPPIDVVYFAGAGGSSEAYKIALGKHPDVALNHNATAIGVHMHNCPETEHLIADVFDIDPRVIRPGVKWRSFWASPDCRHFSPAKGSAPIEAGIRGLAWVVIKVAKLLGDDAPDVIFLENVPAFADWGPVLPPDEKGRVYPDQSKAGETFGLFCKRLRQCGYVVEYKLDWIMAEEGAPTTRCRLLLIARRDGRPIVWPAPTHAPRKVAKARGLKPYPPVADCLDFTIKCPSIFLTQEECKAQGIRAKRPLAEATMARIAKGVERYVLRSGDPFIVPLTHQGERPCHDIEDPARAITAAHRGELALVQPQLMAGAIVGCGSRAAQSPPRGLDDALGTIIGKADRCLATAFLTQFNTRDVGADVLDALRAIPTKDHQGVVTAFMEQANTGMVGRDMREPLSGIVTKGCTQRVVTAHLDYAYGSNVGAAAGDPRDAAKAAMAQGNHHYLVQEELSALAGDRSERLRAFLVKYYGPAVGQDIRDPLHCATTRARFGLVIVQGELMQITDIGMRMLTPRELAAAQGFPKTYDLTWNAMTQRRVTATAQVRLIGNSVSPLGAAPYIAANVPALSEYEREAA
jgi:DNA (cytosine-5)-methyltransferase 1